MERSSPLECCRGHPLLLGISPLGVMEMEFLDGHGNILKLFAGFSTNGFNCNRGTIATEIRISLIPVPTNLDSSIIIDRQMNSC